MAKVQLPVDETVRIPAAVKAQVAKAEEVHNSAYKKDPPAPPVAQGDAPPKAPASVEPPAPAPAEPPLTTQPSDPAPPPAPAKDNWEHAYKSMKGRFDRSEEQKSAMRDQLNAMQDQLDELRRAPPPKKKDLEFERLVTDKDREDYGEDLLQVVGRKAKEELNPLITSLKDRIDELEGQLRGTHNKVHLTERERLFDVMDERLPKWRELNKDPEFLNWLALPDLYSGAIRKQLLHAAFEQNSAPRVLAFFQGFLSEAAGDSARVEPTPSPVLPAPPTSQVRLEDLAAPGRAKSAAAHAPVEKPLISRAQIRTFYTDVANGKYAGRDEEKVRLERMILEANADGRIT
jgi:hypothetical protein